MKKKRVLILLIMIIMIKMAVNRVKEMEVLGKTGMQVMTMLILKIWIFLLHLNLIIIQNWL
jgi:hypothetical protein